MAGDSGSTGHPGSGSSYLPPVFTRWTDRERPAADPGEPALPPDPSNDEARLDEPHLDDVVGHAAESWSDMLDGYVSGTADLGSPSQPAPAQDSELILDDVIEEGVLPESVEEGIPADAFIFAGSETSRPSPPESEWSPARATGDVPLRASTTGGGTDELADRLERFAARLRADGVAALGTGLSGDRLDTLLAGLLAGYLAARDG